MNYRYLAVALIFLEISCGASPPRKNMNQIPLASQDLTETAERLFSEYKVMSPEEWAARYSYMVGSSSFDQYRYRDPVLDSWIHRLHEILRSPLEIKKYREKFLTKEEISIIESKERNSLNGL